MQPSDLHFSGLLSSGTVCAVRLNGADAATVTQRAPVHEGDVFAVVRGVYLVAFGSVSDAVTFAREIVEHDGRTSAAIDAGALEISYRTVHAEPIYRGVAVRRAGWLATTLVEGQVVLTGRARSILGVSRKADNVVRRGRYRTVGGEVECDVFELVGGRATSGRLRAIDATCTNLRLRTPTLHGRAERQAELEDLLRGGSSVAVTGGAGVGKSELVAHTVLNLIQVGELSGGFSCDLRAVASAGDLARAVANVLRLDVGASNGNAATERVSEALRRRRGEILILDNADRLDDDSKELVRCWIEAGEGAQIIVVSREPLEVGQRFEVSPLSAVETRRLFLAACERVGQTVAPETVDRWVSATRGYPLVMRIAAEELISGAALEALEPRPMEAHDAWLEDFLERALSRLGDVERDVLLHCAVFRSTFSLQALEGVLDGIAGHRISGVVDTLANRQLVQRVPVADELMYSLHPVMQDLLEQRWRDSAVWTRARDAHARYFATVAERLEKEQVGARGGAATFDFRRFSSDVLAAFEHAEQNDAATAIRLGLAIQRMARDTLGLSKARDLALRTLELAREEADPELCAEAHYNLAVTLEAQDDAEARAHLDAAEVVAREHGLGSLLGHVFYWRAISASRQDADRAHHLFEQALAQYRVHGPARSEVYALYGLAMLHVDHEEWEPADQMAQEALRCAREAGNPDAVVVAMNARAVICHEQGDYVGAIQLYSEAAEIDSRRRAAPWQMAILRSDLAMVHLDAGSPDDAIALLEDAVELSTRHSPARHLAIFRGNLGAALLLRQNVEAASMHLQYATTSLRERQATSLEALFLGPLAASYVMKGNDRLARSTFERARRLLKDDVDELAVLDAYAMLLAGDRSPDLHDAIDRARALRKHRLLLALRVVEKATGRPLEVGPMLEVEADGAWLRLDGGETVDLRRRGPMKRVLRRLIDERVARPGQPVCLDTVWEAGWPGEIARHDSKRSRVYTTIKRLRNLGLQEVLVSDADGYMIDPGTRVSVHRD